MKNRIYLIFTISIIILATLEGALMAYLAWQHNPQYAVYEYNEIYQHGAWIKQIIEIHYDYIFTIFITNFIMTFLILEILFNALYFMIKYISNLILKLKNI